jgi:HTH-type transcriptional regulator, sugar sensing transcriptional regulator
MKSPATYLRELDLSDLETELYLTLLQTGPIGVRPLTEKIGMKRTTAYQPIDALIAKGLAIKVLKGSQSLIAATDPKEALEQLVEKKVEAAKAIEEQFSDIAQTLSNTFRQDKELNDAEIRFYKGKYGISKIYAEAFRGSEMRLYVNLEALEKILFPNDFGMDYHMFDRALERNNKLTIREIIVDPPQSIEQFNVDETAKKGRYQYKYMNKKIRLGSPGILMYDNHVAIINSSGGLSSIVLYNQNYYDYSKDLFDFTWDGLQ